MSDDIEFSEESLRRIAEQKVTFRYSVKIHAIIYLLVNILLIIINGIFSTNLLLVTEWWAIYPILGWLIGLAIHATTYVLYAKGVRYATRGIVIHLVSYIFTIIFLVVIDFIATDLMLNWVMYPAIFWGLGVIVHIIISTWITRSKSPKIKEKVSKKERAIEKEMQKMRERIKEE